LSRPLCSSMPAQRPLEAARLCCCALPRWRWQASPVPPPQTLLAAPVVARPGRRRHRHLHTLLTTMTMTPTQCRRRPLWIRLRLLRTLCRRSRADSERAPLPPPPRGLGLRPISQAATRPRLRPLLLLRGAGLAAAPPLPGPQPLLPLPPPRCPAPPVRSTQQPKNQPSSLPLAVAVGVASRSPGWPLRGPPLPARGRPPGPRRTGHRPHWASSLFCDPRRCLSQQLLSRSAIPIPLLCSRCSRCSRQGERPLPGLSTLSASGSSRCLRRHLFPATMMGGSKWLGPKRCPRQKEAASSPLRMTGAASMGSIGT